MAYSFFNLFPCIKIAILCTGYSILCCTAINKMVVERFSSFSEYSDRLSIVVASTGDYGLMEKTALRKLLIGKLCYMDTDAYGPPVA